MSSKPKSIPLHTFPDDQSRGILIQKSSVKDIESEIIRKTHRDNYHLFFILEQGKGIFEVDFRQYMISSPAVMYIRPYQVHRGISFEEGLFTTLLVSNDNLNTEYHDLLQKKVLAGPLLLPDEIFGILSDAIAVCLKISKAPEGKLYHPILKDSCNALIGLMISPLLADPDKPHSLTRSEDIMNRFTSLLEDQFAVQKYPKYYADALHLSTAYLNECAKTATGKTISFHIQERIILEAKRLLFHSSKSVKEIACDLGYDDYSYFSRIFSKATGMTALAFRKKSFE